MKTNYYNLMLEEINNIDKNVNPKLLLHSCCAPCSAYVIKFLSNYFDLEILFFNPNIYPKDEYTRRLKEQIRLIKEMGFSYKVIGEKSESELFYNAVKGYEHLGERSDRCVKCFTLRLLETCKYAKENDFDYFTTTLTISPLKDAKILNQIGEELSKQYSIKFLNSDFKKNNGYKHSVDLSKEYNLYRQPYCGCVFSKQEYLERDKNKKINPQ